MSQDRPTAAQLLAAVRDLIEQELLPEAQAGRAFKLRVAVSVLAIVERELTLAPALAAEEHVRLVELLGHEGETRALEQELCARIRDGSLDAQHERVLAYAQLSTNQKLQIANPRYR